MADEGPPPMLLLPGLKDSRDEAAPIDMAEATELDGFAAATAHAPCLGAAAAVEPGTTAAAWASESTKTFVGRPMVVALEGGVIVVNGPPVMAFPLAGSFVLATSPSKQYCPGGTAKAESCTEPTSASLIVGLDMLAVAGADCGEIEQKSASRYSGYSRSRSCGDRMTNEYYVSIQTKALPAVVVHQAAGVPHRQPSPCTHLCRTEPVLPVGRRALDSC